MLARPASPPGSIPAAPATAPRWSWRSRSWPEDLRLAEEAARVGGERLRERTARVADLFARPELADSAGTRHGERKPAWGSMGPGFSHGTKRKTGRPWGGAPYGTVR